MKPCIRWHFLVVIRIPICRLHTQLYCFWCRVSIRLAAERLSWPNCIRFARVQFAETVSRFAWTVSSMVGGLGIILFCIIFFHCGQSAVFFAYLVKRNISTFFFGLPVWVNWGTWHCEAIQVTTNIFSSPVLLVLKCCWRVALDAPKNSNCFIGWQKMNVQQKWKFILIPTATHLKNVIDENATDADQLSVHMVCVIKLPLVPELQLVLLPDNIETGCQIHIIIDRDQGLSCGAKNSKWHVKSNKTDKLWFVITVSWDFLHVTVSLIQFHLYFYNKSILVYAKQNLQSVP